jgi:uncharacterized protein (DUF305 family)
MMNHPIRSICLALAAGLALGLTQAAPGGAHDAMKNTALDCSKADSMMAQPDTSMQAMKPSGDVDKDFAQMMMMHNSKMMAMEKAEVACGKDAKTKAMAQKLLDRASANAAELKKLLGGGI